MAIHLAADGWTATHTDKRAVNGKPAIPARWSQTLSKKHKPTPRAEAQATKTDENVPKRSSWSTMPAYWRECVEHEWRNVREMRTEQIMILCSIGAG